MAKVRVSPCVIANELFGCGTSEVTVLGGYYDGYNFIFDIAGLDVPKVEEVNCKITQQSNQRGDKFYTMEFTEQKK